MIENMSEFGVLIVYWLMGLLRVKDSVERVRFEIGYFCRVYI